MRRNGISLSRDNAAHRAQALALIGRMLREGYDAGQPLPDRLAELVSKIDRVPERHLPQAGRPLNGRSN